MDVCPLAVARISLAVAPYCYEDIAGVSEWRERLHWPVGQDEIAAIGKALPGALLAFAGSMADPFERQVAVVGAGLLGNGFMSLLEAAWVSERAETLALEVRGGPPEMALLHAGQSDFPVQEYRGPFAVKPVPQAGLRAVGGRRAGRRRGGCRCSHPRP